MTPTLSLQLYAQPFVSAGDYVGFKELVDGRARDYDRPLRRLSATRTTRTSTTGRSAPPMSLRWEYRPGSTLFVVWQQGREDVLDQATFRFGRDFGGVFDAPASNVFLVKWAYWLNY